MSPIIDRLLGKEDAVAEEYISLTAEESWVTVCSLPVEEPNTRRVPLSQDGTPTIQELPSLLNE
jgi:hypothetical protein